MKTVFFVLLSVFSLSAVAAPVSFTLEGQVLQVNPRVSYVSIPGACRGAAYPTQPSYYGGRSYVGAAIGGVAGGLLGSRIGKGSGQNVATAAGAVIGAFTGDNIDNDGYAYRGGQQPTQYCEPSSQRQVVDGYDVLVNVQGQQMMFYTRYNPGYGQRIRVNFNGNAELQ